jgi:hypothetical protein
MIYRPTSSPLSRLALGLTLLLALSVSLPLSAKPQDPPAASSDFFIKVIANLKKSEISLDEFERTQKVEKRKTASDPSPLNTIATRLFPAGPGMGKIVVSIDGKPTEPATLRDELEKFEKYLAWAAQEGPAQKDAYARAERKRKDRFDLMDATHQAFLFTLEGKEERAGRTLLRYSMLPNPSYKPTNRNTVLFPRVRGTIWVDEQSSQLAKVDGYVTEDINIALFLAKVYKGSHFMQERYEIAPRVWEPTFEQYDFDGRKFLAPFSIHERTFYTDYKHVGPPQESIQVIRAELNNFPSAAPAH